MAMMVVLLPASDVEPALAPAAVSKLTRLGVTSLVLLRAERVSGLVVEGWAFDPRRSAQDVVAAITDDRAGAQALHSIAEMALSAAPPTHPEEESA